MDNLTLWYKTPAERWTEALPLGNGRMGAMVYGGTAVEKIALTEITCYSGEASPDNSQNGASQHIPEIREALFGNEYEKAELLAGKITGRKLNYGTNLPFGNLTLNFNYRDSDITRYCRQLQLENALSLVEYRAGDIDYTREVFISNPHQVIVIRITCGVPGMLGFTASFDGAGNACSIEPDKCNSLVLKGNAYEAIHSDGKTGVAIHGRACISSDKGKVSARGNTFEVKDACDVVILLALGTDFHGGDGANSCSAAIEAAASIPYTDLLKAHIADHQKLFKRVRFELGEGSGERVSTEQCLDGVKDGMENPALTALMFQYGRYLLMSSSRENSPLPAHLQGVWNDNIACRMGWTCDMHLDVNTEMNYWPSEAANLTECNAPLFHWIEGILMPSGRQTARDTYGLDGWVAHVVSNAWGYSAPGWAANWGIYPTGGIWAAAQMWEHYLFTLDKDFLGSRLYPVYRDAVKFFLKYLVEDPESGYLLSGPSMSPENSFVYDWRHSSPASLSMGAVCDTVLVRELFTSFISACQILGFQDALLDETKEKLEQLPPFRIGKHGQLQEWFHDFDEPDPHHRHTSHLLSVFPFCQVSPDVTPELAEAARISIKKRTTPEWRWEDTGWARAMLILYSARLYDPEAAYRHILAFQRGLTNGNLLSFCPPGAGANTDVFEMDGTTGLCTGICEMLLQSHNGVIHLLPALPKQWPKGFIKGIRARGGFEVDILWNDNELVSAEIYSEHGSACAIRYKDRNVHLQLVRGKRCFLNKVLAACHR